jgi:hypothetical protein
MKTRNSSKSKQACAGGEAREKYRDYNPMKVNPLKKQFEPTPAEAVNQHKRMAGC